MTHNIANANHNQNDKQGYLTMNLARMRGWVGANSWEPPMERGTGETETRAMGRRPAIWPEPALQSSGLNEKRCHGVRCDGDPDSDVRPTPNPAGRLDDRALGCIKYPTKSPPRIEGPNLSAPDVPFVDGR